MSMSSQSAFLPPFPEETRPPLRGGANEVSEGGGGSGGVPPCKKLAAKPLRWYRCKRCTEYVLSFKRARGIHNKKCPPNRDPVEILAQIVFHTDP